MASDKEKLVLKRSQREGVDLSMIHFQQVSTVPQVVSKVVLPMYKKNGKAYIGIRDGLFAGEIIQVGNLNLRYKIVSNMKKKLPEGGGLYRVIRIDGANITNTDIQAISVGDKVRIKSRRSFDQVFQQAVEILDHE